MQNFKKHFIAENLNELFSKRLRNSRSKGIDKYNAKTFEMDYLKKLENIEKKCLKGDYEFTPFLELLKVKGRNKVPRMISIPTIRDRLVLLALKEYLHEIFSENVNRKRPNAFIKSIKNYISKTSTEIHFVKLDVKAFYDTIDHNILLSILLKKNIDPLAYNLIEKAISTPTVPTNAKKDSYGSFTPSKGVPQGTSISNILAQIYLAELDATISKRKYLKGQYKY